MGERAALIRPRWATFLVAIAIAAGGLAGCGLGTPTVELSVLAGSELRDLEPILADMEGATHVKLKLQYIGTLEGADRIQAGDPAQLAWFSHGKYLTLLPQAGARVVAQERIMLSPVVLGLRRSKAQQFGWAGSTTVTWRDIAAKASSGELRFAMTNPTASNSGFTALVGVASAFAGSADALAAGDVHPDELKAFFKGQALTAGSSGFLADAYVREQDRLDGLINYESLLLSLNDGGQLHEPLELIYPKEGIITADYPLMLLDKDQRPAYDKVVAYLRTPEVQRKIMERTLRRPAIPEVALSSRFPDRLLIELPFPNDLAVIDKLLFSWLDTVRVPSSAVFVLDVSGSMNGDRIASLKEALTSLTGLDQSLTGRFARFSARERISIITFNDGITADRDFTIDDTAQDGPDMRAIRDFVNGLQAGGGTAIFSALDQAYVKVAAAQAADPARYYSVVLMTDGENRNGISKDDFLRHLRALPDATQHVKTFAVLFGDASPDELKATAEATGGRVFDARSDPLRDIFKQIRGYQ